MNFPFDKQVEQKLLHAMVDDSGDPDMVDQNHEFVEQKIVDYLNGLKPGDVVSKSPAIKVSAVDNDTVTLLIRGKMKLMKGNMVPFVRMEAKLLKTQLGLDEVSTFIAEIDFKSPDTTPAVEVKMGLGFDGLTLMGRGAARVIPVGLGVDIFIGGINADGFMLGIFVDFPAPVPLGPIPFGLSGVGGEYAHNFKPRIEAGLSVEDPQIDLETGETPPAEIPDLVENPNAVQYVQWARNPQALERWVAADPEEKSRAIGLKASFCDVTTAGNMLLLNRFGFSVIVPGPTIILGGEGKLLGKDTIAAQAYAAVDIPTKSFSLGGAMDMKFPGEVDGLEVKGPIDTYFTFTDPRAWFIRVGTENEPISMKFLKEFDAKIYFELNHYHVKAAVKVSYKRSVPLSILKSILDIYAKVGIGFKALIGWNPWQIAAEASLSGELGVKIWKIKFALSLAAKFWGHVPQPKAFKASIELKFNYPWPMKDLGVKFYAPKIEGKKSPEIQIPFRAGVSPEVPHGALHPMTGRQWNLGEPSDNALDLPWPDSLLVVNFSDQMVDNTGIIRETNPKAGPIMRGGYEVTHELDQLEIIDLETDKPVENLYAHWAASDQNDTAQLHILSDDPYAWLTANASMSASMDMEPPKISMQTFGNGPDEHFSGERRFGDMYVDPVGKGKLTNFFDYFLWARTLSASSLDVAFRQSNGPAIEIDQLRIYAIEYRQTIGSVAKIDINSGGPLTLFAVNHTELLPHLYLIEYEVLIPGGFTMSELNIASVGSDPFHLFAVKYREAEVVVNSCSDKVILTPGKYRLQMAGKTNAVSLHDQPNPSEETWDMTQDFEVIYPPSLRPYLRYITTGDSRVIGPEDEQDNPTLFGVGFPAYRQYRPVTRTKVPYLGEIYPNISFRLQYDDDATPALDVPVNPQTNPNGEDSLLEISKDYQQQFGCPVDADDELEIPDALPKAGPAEMSVWFQPPGQSHRRIDSWSCQISQFLDFADHLDMNMQRLTKVYSANGPDSFSPCIGGIGTKTVTTGGGGQPLTTRNQSTPGKTLVGNPEFPDELAIPPFSWRLPTSLTTLLSASSLPRAVAFGRFALASGVVFGAPGQDSFAGLNTPSSSTRVEALTDANGRLYALWLRTPEPLDWRRVQASLRIRHFEDEGACDDDLAFRLPLDLDVEILPSPDASSAFLVGEFAGFRVRLPRGKYELSLSFDPETSGLPRLRPGPAVGSEQVLLEFNQPSGDNWPN